MSVAIPFFLLLTMQVKLCLMKFALELALQLTVYWQNQWYNIGYFIGYAIGYAIDRAFWDFSNIVEREDLPKIVAYLTLLGPKYTWHGL